MWISIFLSGHDDSYLVHFTLWFFFFAVQWRSEFILISLAPPLLLVDPCIWMLWIFFNSPCCVVDRCVWDHMVRPVAPVGIRKSRCPSHHHRGGEDLHRNHNWRKYSPDECDWGATQNCSLGFSSSAFCSKLKWNTLSSNLKPTEIQNTVASLLHFHARLCHHRGQFLPQLDLLPAPDQPAGVLRGSLWLSHQQGQWRLLTAVSRRQKIPAHA